MPETWDVFAAELADTARSSQYARETNPCVYCGRMTKALSRVCCDHDDLPALEVDALVDEMEVERELDR